MNIQEYFLKKPMFGCTNDNRPTNETINKILDRIMEAFYAVDFGIPSEFEKSSNGMCAAKPNYFLDKLK